MYVQGIKLFLYLSFLTGFAYPFGMTVVSNILYPSQSKGSLVVADKIYSKLVGQEFSENANFWGRPSCTSPSPYNMQNGAASNLDQKSELFISNVENAKRKYMQNAMSAFGNEMLTCSASGLDPDISVESAISQIDRISKERKIDRSILSNIITENINYPFLGLYGNTRVNVVQLNTILENLSGKK